LGKLKKLRRQAWDGLVMEPKALRVSRNGRLDGPAEGGRLIGIGVCRAMASEKLGLGMVPAGLSVQQQDVKVEDECAESPRKRWDLICASGAVRRTRGAHSGGSSR
jgi:hypothetical protein